MDGLSEVAGNAVLERVDVESRGDRIGEGVLESVDWDDCEEALDAFFEANWSPVPRGFTSHLQLKSQNYFSPLDRGYRKNSPRIELNG